ncbi:hypothetical protein KY285_011154 [Solanum tuberosum]|nr:hypothetical protein KY289_011728 [Solanum tuberosum]KAH0735447.1 hypothetical protein KY285_011154 [Solanum tuberosum]
MSAFNPLSTILDHNKLEVPNYIDWRRNHDFVLTDDEEYKFVLYEECLLKQDEQSSDEDKTAMRSLMNTNMVEGTHVRDHVLKMRGLLNDLEVLRDEIDNDSPIEMTLWSLLDSFQQFCLNYNVNTMDLCLAQLLNEQQAAKTIVKKSTSSMTLYVEKGSTSKLQGVQKKKKAHKTKVIAPPTRGMKKPKGKYFHCKMSNH